MTDARSALLAAYLERRDDLLRFFAMRMRSAAAAEDLVQDIYLRIARFDAPTEVHNPVGYLYRLGSNLMLDSLRGERRAARRDQEWRDSNRTVVGTEDVVEESRADDAADARRRVVAIVGILMRMPEQTQRVFRMHKFEGLSHAEVAQELGISRSSVEKHVMAVLKRLAQELP